MNEDDVFEWVNSDGGCGEVPVSLPRGAPDYAPSWERMVFMVQFDGATWLGLEDARRFAAWLSERIAEADVVLAAHPQWADPDDKREGVSEGVCAVDQPRESE